MFSKKNIRIFLLLGFTLTVFACNKEVDDIFDKSASERYKEVADKAKSTLLSADNGWLMSYFPTTESKGYNLFLKFETKDSVVFGMKNELNNNVFSTAGSRYEIIENTAPILNFNTYNDLFHLFSDPAPDGYGYEGDFEFFIQNVTDNEIELKGRKRGTSISMSRVVNNQNLEEYYTQLTELNSYLFNSTVSLELKDGGKVCYILSNTTSHIFIANPFDSNEVDEDQIIHIPIILLSDGITFNQSFEVNGKYVRTFKLNEDKTKLISVEYSDVEIVAEDVYSYFIKGLAPYYTTAQDLSGNFLTVFSAMTTEFNQVYSGRRDLQTIGFYKRDDTFAFMLNTTSNQALFTIPATIVDNKLVISDFDAYNMPDSEMDTNARLFYNAIPAIKEILSLLPGTYNLESKSPFNLNIIELSSISNAGDKMLLSR